MSSQQPLPVAPVTKIARDGDSTNSSKEELRPTKINSFKVSSTDKKSPPRTISPVTRNIPSPDYTPTERTSSLSFKPPSLKKKPPEPEPPPPPGTISAAFGYISSFFTTREPINTKSSGTVGKNQIKKVSSTAEQASTALSQMQKQTEGENETPVVETVAHTPAAPSPAPPPKKTDAKKPSQVTRRSASQSSKPGGKGRGSSPNASKDKKAASPLAALKDAVKPIQASHVKIASNKLSYKVTSKEKEESPVVKPKKDPRKISSAKQTKSPSSLVSSSLQNSRKTTNVNEKADEILPPTMLAKAPRSYQMKSATNVATVTALSNDTSINTPVDESPDKSNSASASLASLYPPKLQVLLDTKRSQHAFEPDEPPVLMPTSNRFTADAFFNEDFSDLTPTFLGPTELPVSPMGTDMLEANLSPCSPGNMFSTTPTLTQNQKNTELPGNSFRRMSSPPPSYKAPKSNTPKQTSNSTVKVSGKSASPSKVSSTSPPFKSYYNQSPSFKVALSPTVMPLRTSPHISPMYVNPNKISIYGSMPGHTMIPSAQANEVKPKARSVSSDPKAKSPSSSKKTTDKRGASPQKKAPVGKSSPGGGKSSPGGGKSSPGGGKSSPGGGKSSPGTSKSLAAQPKGRTQSPQKGASARDKSPKVEAPSSSSGVCEIPVLPPCERSSNVRYVPDTTVTPTPIANDSTATGVATSAAGAAAFAAASAATAATFSSTAPISVAKDSTIVTAASVKDASAASHKDNTVSSDAAVSPASATTTAKTATPPRQAKEISHLMNKFGWNDETERSNNNTASTRYEPTTPCHIISPQTLPLSERSSPRRIEEPPEHHLHTNANAIDKVVTLPSHVGTISQHDLVRELSESDSEIDYTDSLENYGGNPVLHAAATTMLGEFP